MTAPAAGRDPREREILWPDADRVWRAMMLAPTRSICVALLRGESVPLERLDQDWLRRFGVKNARG